MVNIKKSFIAVFGAGALPGATAIYVSGTPDDISVPQDNATQKLFAKQTSDEKEASFMQGDHMIKRDGNLQVKQNVQLPNPIQKPMDLINTERESTFRRLPGSPARSTHEYEFSDSPSKNVNHLFGAKYSMKEFDMISNELFDAQKLQSLTYDRSLLVSQKPIPTQNQIVEQPILEQPILEQPILEQPIVEQPILEQQQNQCDLHDPRHREARAAKVERFRERRMNGYFKPGKKVRYAGKSKSAQGRLRATGRFFSVEDACRFLGIEENAYERDQMQDMLDLRIQKIEAQIPLGLLKLKCGTTVKTIQGLSIEKLTEAYNIASKMKPPPIFKVNKTVRANKEANEE